MKKLALVLCLLVAGGCRTIDLEVIGADGSNTHLKSTSVFQNTDELIGAEIIGVDGASAKADSAKGTSDMAAIIEAAIKAGMAAGAAAP